MATIIPRWEWRTFGSDFNGADEKIMALNPSVKKSSEKYILSRNSNENCKIRDDLMDIKSPQAVNEDKLEQWFPTLKESFEYSSSSMVKRCGLHRSELLKFFRWKYQLSTIT